MLGRRELLPNRTQATTRQASRALWLTSRFRLLGMELRVADLLTRVDLRRLKVCPECKRLFLAVRRQRFDTAQCSLRDRVRRFREQQRQPRPRRKR